MKLKLSDLKLQSFVTSLEEAHKRTVVGGDCPQGYQSYETHGTGTPTTETGNYMCPGTCPNGGGTVQSSPCNCPTVATCASVNYGCGGGTQGGTGCSNPATGYACVSQHC